MSSKNPILKTVRKLLRVQGYCTLSQVASYCEDASKPHVLDVLDRNKSLLEFDDNRIVNEVVQKKLRKRMWNEGKYWRESKINYGADVEFNFKNHEDLKEELQVKYTAGGLGDSYTLTPVLKNEENEKALREAGLVPYEEIDLDDRLWEE